MSGWVDVLVGGLAVLAAAAVAVIGRRASVRCRRYDAIARAMTERARMTDAVAERHRAAAETASAGMFELLTRLVGADEAVRGQLAAELHDTVAQSLATSRRLLSDAAADPQQLRLAAELVSESEEQVRALMARTRPPALREGDLARAVVGLKTDLWQRYAVDVVITWPEQAHPLPLATAVTTYRFFQEGLLNVVKHADVDAAAISLHVDDEWVVATVGDEGPGFDPAEVRAEGGRHVGLGLMRERARLFGGTLDIESWPGNGVTITLRLPRQSRVSASTDAGRTRGLPVQHRPGGQPGPAGVHLAGGASDRPFYEGVALFG